MKTIRIKTKELINLKNNIPSAKVYLWSRHNVPRGCDEYFLGLRIGGWEYFSPAPHVLYHEDLYKFLDAINSGRGREVYDADMKSRRRAVEVFHFNPALAEEY